MQEERPFAEQDDFKDIVPIPQDDGEKPVCPIAYAPECKLKRLPIITIRR